MNLQDKTQIFLLHFAGGSYYSFDFLKKHMLSIFEFIPLELPGRGKRSNESLLLEKGAAIEDYVRQIKQRRNDQNYLIYGHSMGATLGLSIAHQLQEQGDPPAALIVSGNAGPGVADINDAGEPITYKRYLLSDEDFKKELKRMGGATEDVLKNEDFYQFFNPILRADFEVLEKDDDQREEKIVLNCPLYALMGTEENTVAQLQNWKRFTNSDFNYKTLPGNHFFIYDHPKGVANVIMNCSGVLNIL